MTIENRVYSAERPTHLMSPAWSFNKGEKFTLERTWDGKTQRYLCFVIRPNGNEKAVIEAETHGRLLERSTLTP